jgi:hypothetical protein
MALVPLHVTCGVSHKNATPLAKTVDVSFDSYDTWSELYVGIHHLVYDILPPTVSQQKAEDRVLCQLAIVGANHMMEFALFDLIRPHIDIKKDNKNNIIVTQEKYKDAKYYTALSNWVEQLTDEKIDLKKEPFLSTECVRKRRNSTVHKESALATVEMARSALFSVVEGTKELYSHFKKQFPENYQHFMDKYPLREEAWFSTLKLP